MANALAVLAIAPRGGLLYAPDTYMDKIAVGPGYPEGLVDLDAAVEDNIAAVAKAKGVPTSEITLCVLDRPRHEAIIASARKMGSRVFLIPDGDVAGVFHTTEVSTGIDLYVGQGGAQAGVIADLTALHGHIEVHADQGGLAGEIFCVVESAEGHGYSPPLIPAKAGTQVFREAR